MAYEPHAVMGTEINICYGQFSELSIEQGVSHMRRQQTYNQNNMFAAD